MALLSGVSVASEGACNTTIEDAPQETRCMSSEGCGEGLICDRSHQSSCDEAPLSGVCRLPNNGMCTMQWEPECGCDGVTYGNACARVMAGAGLAKVGECTTPTDTSTESGVTSDTEEEVE